jgi:hypothetical protein
MPTYSITIGALTADHVQAGTDNAGLRKSAFIAVANGMGIARQHGVHGHCVPDGVDANAREVRVPRGAGDAGAWEDTPAPKLAQAQAVVPQAQGAESGIVERPSAEEPVTKSLKRAAK